MEREKEKQELLGVKLKKRGIMVGKRGNTSTPSLTWRFENTFNFPSTLSARKLAANLWKTQPHHNLSKMNKNKGARTLTKPRHHTLETVDFFGKFDEPHDHSPSYKMLTQDCANVGSSSPKIKGRFGNSSYSLKTSTELLKVLNKIWSLEEQHASNALLTKALKKELDHSQIQIKELQREKERDQQEIDYLKKKTGKEQDEMKHVIRSMRDGLEDERKIRKRSESLERKLARDLSEIKLSFANGLKEIERERSARVLLEELCDEFAKGIKDYEEEVRSLKQNKKNDPIDDRLILHVSEAWIDGRIQMKQAELCDNLAEKKSVTQKLSFEIDTFLQAKRTEISENSTLPHTKEQTKQEMDRHGDLLKSKSLSAISRKLWHENISMEDTFDPLKFTGPASPVLKWTSTIKTPKPESTEATLKQCQSIKENTLRAKLLEARLESKSKTSKGLSRVDQVKG